MRNCEALISLSHKIRRWRTPPAPDRGRFGCLAGQPLSGDHGNMGSDFTHLGTKSLFKRQLVFWHVAVQKPVLD